MKYRKKLSILIICIVIVILTIASVRKFINHKTAEQERVNHAEAMASLTAEQLENFRYIGWDEEELETKGSGIINEYKDDRELNINFSYPYVISKLGDDQIVYETAKHEVDSSNPCSRDEIIELSKNKTTIEYDEILVYKNEDACKWMIEFLNSETDKRQYIFYYTDGVFHAATVEMEEILY